MQLSLECHLQRAASGDSASFRALYDATSRRVFGMVRRVLVDPAQTEEVVQEVFLEAWRLADRFDPARGSAATWLLGMAHRRAVDRVRATRAQRSRDVADAARASASPVVSVYEAVERAMDAGRVHSALRALSEAQRQAIVLAYFGGFTQTEIAVHLGIPLGTVKTRMRDGMERLRRCFHVDGALADGHASR